LLHAADVDLAKQPAVVPPTPTGHAAGSKPDGGRSSRHAWSLVRTTSRLMPGRAPRAGTETEVRATWLPSQAPVEHTLRLVGYRLEAHQPRPSSLPCGSTKSRPVPGPTPPMKLDSELLPAFHAWDASLHPPARSGSAAVVHLVMLGSQAQAASGRRAGSGRRRRRGRAPCWTA